LHGGAEQEDRRGGVAAFVDADQMARHRDQAEELILETRREEAKHDLLLGVDPVHALEGLGIADTLDAVDVRPELSVVEPVDALRRHQPALRLGRVGVGVREKVRAEDDQVEPGHDDGAGHRNPMLAEPPPRQLPLRGDEDALVLSDRHHVSSSRIRGSIHTRRMSEISVPITVMIPRSSTIVPARNMSWAMRALRSSGPTVGKPSTSETMMLPETMYGLRSSSSRFARMIRICCAVPARPRISAGIGRCLSRSQTLAALQSASCSSTENRPPMWALKKT